MKLQAVALGLALAVAGSAFAATHETTVTKVTPHGTVTKHIVRSNDHDMYRNRHLRRVVVVHPEHRHHVKKVVIVHPAHHGNYASNRTVVIHRHG